MSIESMTAFIDAREREAAEPCPNCGLSTKSYVEAQHDAAIGRQNTEAWRKDALAQMEALNKLPAARRGDWTPLNIALFVAALFGWLVVIAMVIR